MFLYTEKLGPSGEGGGAAPWTITWNCVFLDHNLKLSPNRALLKWCFRKVATLRWRLLLRPQVSLAHIHVQYVYVDTNSVLNWCTCVHIH